MLQRSVNIGHSQSVSDAFTVTVEMQLMTLTVSVNVNFSDFNCLAATWSLDFTFYSLMIL